MARNVRLSRLNPVYLAYRHAGGFVLFLVLGIVAGLTARTILTPHAYESDFRRSFAIMPATAAAGYDWDGKLREWSRAVSDRDRRVLLTANLRAAVKRSAFPPSDPAKGTPDRLREELLAFRTPRRYAAFPPTGRFRPYFGPEVEVARHDLAANMDFQSLARLVCDLDPRPGAAGWDFTAEGDAIGKLTAGDRLIVSPGPDDPHFKVFYRLHTLLHDGSAAGSPAEAWLTAVGEVETRIAREFEFAGGGGFGPLALRELAAELNAIPVLVANSLYHAAFALYGDDDSAKGETDLWETRWLADTRLDLDHDGAARGRLSVAMRSLLHPFAFPVDSPLTRIAPLALRTLFAFIEAGESRLGKNRLPEPSPAPVEAPAPEEAPPAGDAVRAEREALAAAAREREKQRAGLAGAAHRARVRRDEAGRRLEAARIAAGQLAGEAAAARDRADRLKERLDGAEAAAVIRHDPEPDPERAGLEEEREALLRYIALLLQNCTDEHPFVVQARRELAVLDGRLALLAPKAETDADGQDRTRLLNLRAEWSAASNSASGLAERLKRRRDEAERRLAEFSDAERDLAEREFALASAREENPPAPANPVQEINRNIEEIVGRLATMASGKTPPGTDKPGAEPPPPEPAPPMDAMVSFSSLPDVIPLVGLTPSAMPVYLGAALGLCLGAAYVLLREILSFRLSDAYMARHFIDLPLLAVLPAYDGKSLADAARIDGGRLVDRDGRRTYVPSDLEKREPPPLGKRKPLRPRARKRRLLPWIAAGLALLSGFALHQAAARGWLTPAPPLAADVWRRSPPLWTPYAEDDDR